MSLRLYLIRHGETEWSHAGKHTGNSDIELTPHGEEQAAQLAPLLADTQFSHVLTSPRQRARNTCRLAGLGDAAIVEPDLAEWDYGDFEGKTADDIRKIVPGWTAFGNGFRNGESFDAVSARADRVIAHMTTLTGNVALFSHGHFSCILAARWIGLPMQGAEKLVLNTASVSILGTNPHHPELRVIAMWNVLPAMFG